MKLIKIISSPGRFSIMAFSCWLLMLVSTLEVFGQEPPPYPMTVTASPTQYLRFGAFYQGGAGGTVIVSSAGSRSSTGDVVLLNMGYTWSAELYDIVANPGTLVSILNGSDATLTGSGGGTMTLHIGDSSPASPFVITTTPPASTQLRIGGTLTVGPPGANPPGNYSGTFNVTFIQE